MMCDSSSHSHVYLEDANVNFLEVIFYGTTMHNCYTKAGG